MVRGIGPNVNPFTSNQFQVNNNKQQISFKGDSQSSSVLAPQLGKDVFDSKLRQISAEKSVVIRFGKRAKDLHEKSKKKGKELAFKGGAYIPFQGARVFILQNTQTPQLLGDMLEASQA